MEIRKLKVLLAEDHVIMREGMKSLLKHLSGNEISVLEAQDGEQAIDIYRNSRKIDLVIMDVRMPVKDGITACREILEIDKKARVLFLSMYNDAMSIREAFEAGACGYLTKNSGIEEIFDAMSKILNGEKYFSSGSMMQYLGLSSSARSHAIVDDSNTKRHLTNREQEVLYLISSEKTSVEIANTLMVNIKTVEKYRKNLIEKFSVKTSVGLVKKAIRDGWISPGENFV